MRKHFLLLFLMALLPLAGWATITVDTQPTLKAAATYDGNGHLVIDADGTCHGQAASGYVWKYYASKSNVPSTTPADWKEKGELEVTAGGAYNVWFIVESPAEGEDSYEPTLLASKFNVNQAALVVTAPTKITGIVYDGASHELINAGSCAKGTIEYKVGDGDWSTGLPTGINAGSYNVYYKVTATDPNYADVASTQIAGTAIAAKPLSTDVEKYTITVTDNDKRYNGKVQKATVTILDIARDVNLIEGTDFSVAYYDGSTPTDPKNAKDYTIKVTGLANYATAEFALTPTHVINRPTVYVKVKDVSKTYDGAAYNPAVNPVFQFEYSGLRNGETAAAVVTGTPEVEATLYNMITVAGQHKVLKVTANGDGSVKNILADNYVFVPSTEKGTLTINKHALTIAFPATYTDDVNQKTYGANDPVFNATWIGNNLTVTGALDDTEKAAILGELAVTRSDAGTDEGEAFGEHTGVLGLSLADANDHDALDNYDIDIATVTGDFNINKAALTIQPADIELTYNGTAYTGAARTLTVNSVDKLLIEGWKRNDADNAATLIDMSKLTFTIEDNARNVGYYDVELASTLTLDNYNITTYTGEAHIVPATVTATIPTQTLKIGENTFDVNRWSVTGIVGTDDAEDFAHTLSNTAAAIVLTNEAGYTTAGKYNTNNGSSLKITNPNYVLDRADVNGKVWGTVVVLAADQFILNPASTDMATQLATLNGQPGMTITFEEMPMAANEWRAMVLPFEVKTAELVKNLGVYVIVNKFKSASYDKKNPTKVNVNFAVEMNKVEAGVPFLIKPAEDINWNKDVENADIQFTGKTIVGAPIAQGQLAATPTDDKATFKGTYNKGEILWWGHGLDGTTTNPLKSKWLSYNGADRYKEGSTTEKESEPYTNNAWKEPETRPHLLSPMEAYVILDEAATDARIFVEDIENGTTAIKELGVDGTNKAYNVDGWYTLNGVKLQNAPVEKGIYINNGKKVVIK